MSETNQWCGICVDYTVHDTAHHTSGGTPVRGDMVTLTIPPDDWQHLKGKRGRVEQVRGSLLSVAIPVASGTVTLQVFASQVA